MKFILGEKLDMTQAFKEDGTVIPVTRVQAGPCVVTQVKSSEVNNNEVNAVQIGFGEQKEFRLNKPQQKHLKDIDPVKVMRDFRLEKETKLSRGDKFTVSVFEKGDTVDVQGETKGKGFQGVVKRYDFAGAPATHGTKDQHRMPGSAGPTGPSRVFKGKKMPGRMGDDTTTIQNLEIIKVKEEDDELWIKGGLPGAKGNLLKIYCDEGEIEVQQEESGDEQEKASKNKKETKEE